MSKSLALKASQRIRDVWSDWASDVGHFNPGLICGSTPPPTMEPNKGGSPPGHLTCVRHGTYLRGGAAGYSSTGSGFDPPVHLGHPNCNTNPKAAVFGIPKRTTYWKHGTNHQPIDRSGLTPASPVYPEKHWSQRARNRNPRLHFPPGTGRHHTANMQMQRVVELEWDEEVGMIRDEVSIEVNISLVEGALEDVEDKSLPEWQRRQCGN
ncbi:hypothetical protein TNCV_4689611 [Trichonephila clavipes]|nr:hypothetical protein TNCV_4689611 [Trichonephila clavipes]